MKSIDGDGSGLHQLNVPEDPFELEPLHDFNTDSSDESQAEAGVPVIEDTPSELADIWSLDSPNDGASQKGQLRSWGKVNDRSFLEPVSAYFSESGAKGFDAALAHQAARNKTSSAGRLVRNDCFVHALLRLGLGWDSIFFWYNEQTGTFKMVLRDVRVSGVSVPAVNMLTEEMLQCGTDMQRIRAFVSNHPVRADNIPALSTLSGVIAVVAYTLEKRLVERSEHAISLLQIKALFERPVQIVYVLVSLVESVQKAATDAEIISTVFERVAYFCHRFTWMEKLLHEISIRVAEPWLRLVEGWVGLRSESPASIDQVTSGRAFAALELREENSRMKSGSREQEYTYRPEQVPSFIPPDQARLIFDCGRNLRILKQAHPQHPLANGSILQVVDPPSLVCSVTWADIEGIQGRAQEYEVRLRAEVLKYTSSEGAREEFQVESAPDDLEEQEKHKIYTQTFELFDPEDKEAGTGLLGGPSSMEKDKLSQLLGTSEYGAEQSAMSFGPELSCTPYLSLAPVISSQALLIDFSFLHLMFKEQKLAEHLRLQWRFQLLGDGNFTSRLTHLLLDPELKSGEQQSGAVRSDVHTGLRLGNRDTWPPASSELRLVLVGLLTECYFTSNAPGSSANVRPNEQRELPGDMSFSIRELGEEEMTRCKDPNSIEALDFMRLQYRPPAILEAIITQQSLTKYDRLFRHLLRLIRMVSVANGLIQDSTSRSSLSGDTRNVFQRFRVDAQRFVLAVSDYCFQVGATSTWQRFQDNLSKVERCLNQGDIDGTMEAAHSVNKLRGYHEDVLDQILFALFLSKKHSQAGKLLEDIFQTILTFAPLSRMDGTSGVRHESERSVLKLYAVFRKQSSAFVSYLRSLDGERASSKSLGRISNTFASELESTAVFDHLLSRLDIREYF